LKADTEFYLSCKGSPSVKKEGSFFSSSDTFEVTFVDESGLKHTLHGVHKVESSELPTMVDMRMPNPLPPTDGTDSSGQPYKEGHVYTWADGAKAQFKNRSWVAIKELNTICNPK
jgi:hypothetical protein